MWKMEKHETPHNQFNTSNKMTNYALEKITDQSDTRKKKKQLNIRHKVANWAQHKMTQRFKKGI